MKYIRTKDGNILERKEELGHFYYENREITSYYYNEQNNLSLDDFLKERGGIIKQADTIEELCDEFVKIFEDGDRSISKKLNYMCKTVGRRINLSNSVSCQYVAITSIYGAIWTDKGLIYVAKMNHEGKLELL